MEENKTEDTKIESNNIPLKPVLKQPKADPPKDSHENSASPEQTVSATVEQEPNSPSPDFSIPERPKSPEPPIDINPLLPLDGTLDIHNFRSTSPIPEDPNEDASASNSRRTSESSKIPDKQNSIKDHLSPQQSLDSIPSRPATPTTESKRSTPIPKIETPPQDESSPRPKSPRPKTPEGGKLSPVPPDMGTNQAMQGSPSHGKSKTTGKNLTGWF